MCRFFGGASPEPVRLVAENSTIPALAKSSHGQNAPDLVCAVEDAWTIWLGLATPRGPGILIWTLRTQRQSRGVGQTNQNRNPEKVLRCNGVLRDPALLAAAGSCAGCSF